MADGTDNNVSLCSAPPPAPPAWSIIRERDAAVKSVRSVRAAAKKAIIKPESILMGTARNSISRINASGSGSKRRSTPSLDSDHPAVANTNSGEPSASAAGHMLCIESELSPGAAISQEQDCDKGENKRVKIEQECSTESAECKSQDLTCNNKSPFTLPDHLLAIHTIDGMIQSKNESEIAAGSLDVTSFSNGTSIEQIFGDYQQHVEEDTELSEIQRHDLLTAVDGFRIDFNQRCHTLLYKHEVVEFDLNNPMSSIEIYGFVHLLRMMNVIGAILKKRSDKISKLEDKDNSESKKNRGGSLSAVETSWLYFVGFLDKNREKYWSVDCY